MDGETETQELPMFDDGPTEDVDIEITEEDLGENLADFDDSEEEEEAPPSSSPPLSAKPASAAGRHSTSSAPRLRHSLFLWPAASV